MAIQDTATKEQIVAALQEQNITDLDSLAEFMIEKRASLTPYQGDQGGQPTTQGEDRTIAGGWFVYTRKVE